MRLLIYCNHSLPDHIGGSEQITMQIAESMVLDFGMEVTICSMSCETPTMHNGVKIIPWSSNFLKIINEHDHVFIYSDYFKHLPLILKNLPSIKSKVSIALVGMNKMRGQSLSDKQCLDLFRRNHSKLSIIVHSKGYLDYKQCRKYNIPSEVIPNFVDLSEFDSNNINFREKYNIDSKYIILCVSNYFQGKGQEYLSRIYKEISSDFTAVMISSKVNYMQSKVLLKTCKDDFKRNNINSLFLEDISRKDVVSAFNCADVFSFPSQKEVSPLVILESMASNTPWVSLPVGNTPDLKGGLIIPHRGLDRKGNMRYDANSFKKFGEAIQNVLEDNKLNKKLKQEGRECVEKEYNDNNVINSYYRMFSNEKTFG